MLAYAQVQDENAKFEVPRHKAARIINQAVGVHLTSEVRVIRNLSTIAESYILRDLKISPAAEFFRTPLIVIVSSQNPSCVYNVLCLVSLIPVYSRVSL